MGEYAKHPDQGLTVGTHHVRLRLANNSKGLHEPTAALSQTKKRVTRPSIGTPKWEPQKLLEFEIRTNSLRREGMSSPEP